MIQLLLCYARLPASLPPAREWQKAVFGWWLIRGKPPDKPSRERLSRHYYDLYRLAQQPIAEQALVQRDLLERVIAHKSFFFAAAWAHYETARPGTFRLLPVADRLAALRRDYQDMETMIFGGVPAWGDIVRELERLEARINTFRLPVMSSST